MQRFPLQIESVILILFTTFAAVFVAEIVGDKLLYTTGVLAARYRTAPIFIGLATAFMGQMGLARFIGKTILKLPSPPLAPLTPIRFFRGAVPLLAQTNCAPA